MPLCHWSSQLFNLRAPSSTDVPVLLLNQPITLNNSAVFNGFRCSNNFLKFLCSFKKCIPVHLLLFLVQRFDLFYSFCTFFCTSYVSGRLYPQVEPKICPECEARAGDFLFSAAKACERAAARPSKKRYL